VFIKIFNQREYISLSQPKDSDFVDVNIKAVEVRGDKSHQVLNKKIKVNKNDIPPELKAIILKNNLQAKKVENIKSSDIKITKQDILNLKIPKSFNGLFESGSEK